MFITTTQRAHDRRLTTRIAAVLALLIALLVLPVGTADATVIWNPNLTITGEPTPDESVEIQRLWKWMNEAFPSAQSCMRPLTVHVVDRAEDHYSYPISFSIAAFYRFPPSSTVFVEHGKVKPEIMLHEFAHHMDVSCGFGESHHGEHFLEAEGYSVQHDWISGSSWYKVPAERFAEAVIDFMGVGKVDIRVSDEALELVARWSTESRDVPTEVRPGLIVA